MAILKVLLFHFFIIPIIHAFEDCPFSSCLDSKIVIRFPFRIQEEQHSYCGYPGFSLTCTNGSRTVLKFPYSGEFYVRNINYLSQQIQLYDPDDCLPKRLLSLNLSGSPFVAIFRRNYTFLSCPSQNTRSEFTAIDCLSNSTSFISAIPSAVLGNSLPEPSCSVISRPSVPVGMNEEDLRDDLSEDLLLTWHTPNCRDCESREEMCGFESTDSDRVRCFSDSKSANSQGLRLFRIIILSITGPAVICVTIIACFACYMDSRRGIITPSRILSPPPSTTAATMGLDECTIESYQKVVLGESRRLPPGPNGGTCAICLSEYNTKDTVRCIPECRHCFHCECIDEWLRMNSTCPVCRNFPSTSSSSTPLHVMSTQSNT